MTRIVMTAKVCSDGVLHLALPATAADQEVQVTVEPVSPQRQLTAADLLHSDLVGMWADRTDIVDSRDFARRLREQAQKRNQNL